MSDAAPRFCTPRSSRDTVGPQITGALRRIERQPAMPWQQLVADVAGEIDPATGRFWYREVVVVVLRQAGKTSLSRAKITHRCLTEPGSFVLYTAQNRNKSLERLKRSFHARLLGSPFAPELGAPRWAAGSEAVRWRNGSEIFIDAPTKKTAIHGDTLPEAHIDEAFAHADGRIDAAVNPTMVTVLGAQKWVTSAAGDSSSTYLWGKVEAGRARSEAGTHGRIAYFEFSAPDGADPADPAVWAATHPAVGHTIALDTLQAEYDSLWPDAPEEFCRAYLGWWPRAKARPWVIPQTSWEGCAVDEADLDAWSGTPAWSIDVDPGRTQASIGLTAAHPAGRCWVECVAHEPGTQWVIPHLQQLAGLFGGRDVAIDATNNLTMRTDLEEAGFTVHTFGQRDKVAACGGLYDDALAQRIVHGGAEGLAAALRAAKKRDVDDAWLFSRSRSDDDITELYATAFARHLWVRIHGTDYDTEDSLG